MEATVVADPRVVLDAEGCVWVDGVDVDDEESGLQATSANKNAPIRTWRDFTPEGYRAVIDILRPAEAGT